MVYHILKDGTITNDITGHVVKMKDAEVMYQLMRETKVKKDRRSKNVQSRRQSVS